MIWIRIGIIILILSLIIVFSVSAQTPIDFSISDNVLKAGEPTDIEFNINNTHNVPLALYGYASKGNLEIFDEYSQAWIISTNTNFATKIFTKTKIRISGVTNQEISIYFLLVDPSGSHSYKTIAKSIWVGTYEIDYINRLNSTLESSSSLVLVSNPLENEPSVNPLIKKTYLTSNSYLGIGLIIVSFLAITLLSMVMIKYINAQTKQMDPLANGNADYICSIVDTWESNT